MREHFSSVLLVPDGQDVGRCISHLRRVMTGPCELILIGDGPSEQADLLARSFQEAVAMAKGDMIALVRASSYPGEEWLTRLRRTLFARPGYGVAAPLEQYTGEPLQSEQILSLSQSLGRAAEFRRVLAREVVDSCAVMRREIAEAAAAQGASTLGGIVQDIWIQSAARGFKAVLAGDTVVLIQGTPSRRKSIRALLAAVAGETRGALAIQCGLLRVRELVEAGALEMALEAQRAMVQRYPRDRSLVRELGWLLLRGGWAEQARELLCERTAGECDDPEWLKLEGYCAEALGDLDRAETCAARVLNEQPLSSRAAFLRGLTSTARGDGAAAERGFRAAIVADPSRGNAHAHLGSLLWARGERQAGLAELERAFILSPQETEIAVTYTDAATQLGRGTRARELVVEACRLNPGVRLLHQLKASFLLSEGRVREGLDVLLEVMGRFGADDDTLNAAVQLRKDIEREASGEIPSMPRLSLCMIVKDEQSNLARCLWSALAVVDEIVVVDTGSLDRSIDLALAFGSRVLRYAWDRSFSNARNAGLAAARGAWILVLDADEVLSFQDHQRLRDLVTGNGATRQAYSILIRNYVASAGLTGWRRNDGSYDEEAGSGWIPSVKVRLFPRDARIRFEGAAHELVEPCLGRAGYRVQDVSAVVHHYGRLDHHRPRREGLAYRELEVSDLASDQDESPEALSGLAVQEEELGNFAEALVHWRRYIELVPDDPRAFLGAGTSAIGAGDMEAAVESLERARRLWPERPEPRVHLAIALMHAGRTQEALVLVREVAREHPGYDRAGAVLALLLLANGLHNDGLRLVRELEEAGVSLTAFFTGHGRRLLKVGPRELAVAVLQPLADAGMITPEQGSILIQAYRDQSALT